MNNQISMYANRLEPVPPTASMKQMLIPPEPEATWYKTQHLATTLNILMTAATRKILAECDDAWLQKI
jgi:hypothetical protein